MQCIDAVCIVTSSDEEICSKMSNGSDFEIYNLENFYHTKDSDQTYRPYTAFAIAHDTHNLYIKFFISENETRAVYLQNQKDPVWEDSCVEFFIKTEGSEVFKDNDKEFTKTGIF